MSKRKEKYIPAPTGEDLERIETGEKFSEITATPMQKVINGALSEDVDEIADMSSSEDENLPEEGKKKKSKRRTVYLWLGVFVTIMTIVGIIFTAMSGVKLVKNIADNTAQKKMFAKYLYPFVIVDVPVTEDTTKLPIETILRTAAWDIIINYDPDYSKYTEEYGYITVPASDLEVVATRMFGKNLEFKHQPLGDSVLYFAYNEDTNSYVLPVEPNTMSYRPKVETIKKLSDNTFEIRLGYYVPAQDWQSDSKKNQADKYLKYTVVKENDGYRVLSIGEYEDSYVNPQ